MKAVILAAGTSTRLRPLTDHTPKCLLEVGGVPILDRALTSLVAAGIDGVVLVTGYLEEQVRAAVTRRFPRLRASFITNSAYASTNNAASLLCARPELDGSPFLLLDGDIVFERAVVDAVLAAPPGNCLALRPSSDLGLEEIKVELDGERRVRRIGKDVPPERAAGESIGIERFSAATSKDLFATLERRVVGRGLVNEWYEASFQELIDAGTNLTAVDVGTATCTEIDTPADLAAAERAISGAARVA